MGILSSDPDAAPLGHEYWESDDQVSQCRGCHAVFGMMRRKHHCRACGRIFCNQCTSWRLNVHRAHYAAGQIRRKRVCVECYECDGRARKFLETVKEDSHIADVLPFDPSDRTHFASLVSEDAVYTTALDVVAMLQTEPSTPAFLGLPKIPILAVDHHEDGFSGKQFFVNPSAWSSILDATRMPTTTGSEVQVVQYRNEARVWSGKVVVRNVGACCYGKRTVGADHCQWREGDVIVLGCIAEQKRWLADDVVNLGTTTETFDFTVPRVDSSSYPSVESALHALNVGTLACEEGICILEAADQGHCFLLVREDR